MNRRAYLATVTAACLAGCTGAETSGPNRSAERNESAGDPEVPESEPGPKPDRLVPGAADDFETLSRWSVEGGAVAPDTEHVVVGSQSARLEVPADEGSTRLSLEYESPFDLSEVVPGVAVASDEVIAPWLRLVDVDGNRIDYRRTIDGELPLMRYNFGVDEREAAFDPTAVTGVTLSVWTADGQSPTLWFDDLHFAPRPDTGTVMIQFDDNHATDYTEALPILEEYDYPAVTFVNPARIEAETDGRGNFDYPRLTVDQTHELHDAGWTISNHCWDHPHLSELDAAEQEREIRKGKEWLESEGFEEGAQYFAYPHGDYDATTIELVGDYHDLGFAGGLPVQGYTTNRVLASRIGEPTAERMAVELERTAKARGITSFFFHELEGELLEDFETTIETLHEYESAGEIEVILPKDLERKYLHYPP